ncbi:hypothetical protein ACFL6U_33180, partial [Planctomycetota bacterium]
MVRKALFVLALAILGLNPGNVSGARLFNDGFESGDFSSGGWTAQNGNATVSNKAEYAGTYGVKLAGTTWIERAVSTAGYNNIHVKYYRKTKGMDSGEYFYAEWYDGSSWNTLASTQSTSWDSQQDHTCGSGANDNSSYKIRFRTNASATNEYAYLDSVEITGDVLVTPGVTITASGGSTDVAEQGPTSDTYTVVLDSQPSSTVTITVDPDGQTEVNNNGAGNSVDLTFLTTNWDSAQTITVTAIDDSSIEGAHSSTITHSASSSDSNYNGISIANVVASIADNDNAGVTLVESNGSTAVNEQGPTSDTYTVVLDAQPSSTVTITVDPDSQSEVNSNGAGNSVDLTFLTTNWDSPQTITVRAIDDSNIEGAHSSTITHSAASSDTNYDGLSIGNIVATITDNDTAGVTITESGGSTDVAEEGPTSDTYTVVLDSQPSSTVTVTVDPDSQSEVNSSGAGNSVDLTFLTTNWDSPQTVTVTAINDSSVEGAHTSTITQTAASSDTNYQGISIGDVVANITDNDTAGVTIVESGGSTDVAEEGPTSDTYTVVLDSQPSGTVTITVDPDSQSEVNSSGAGNSVDLTFLTTNWDSPQTVTVTAIDDTDIEGAHSST